MSQSASKDAPSEPLTASDVSYTSFAQFPLADSLKDALAKAGFTAPTPVQGAVVDAALAGHDLLVQSQTGSGKTLAFGLPLVQRLMGKDRARPGLPRGLVVVPTRELAFQVAAELRKVVSEEECRIVTIYGGVPLNRQISSLRAGAELLVGTPGRLLDHLRRGNVSLSQVETMVLDEADEMLSMGFWEDVTTLFAKLPKQRQVMLFSATLPYDIAKAAAQFLNAPQRIDLSGQGLTVASIRNAIFNVSPGVPKPRQMLYLLEYTRPESAIIFCNTRNETEMLAKYLTQSGFVADALTGNFRQKEREHVIARIKSGELKYMVATDIAARGIDIDDLAYVFNYALPEFGAVYLHRAGRTGRIGKAGCAVSLVDGKGLATYTQLEREFGVAFEQMVLPDERELTKLRSQRMIKELTEKAKMAEVSAHLPVAEEVLHSEQASAVVAFLLRSYYSNQAEPYRASEARHVDKEEAPAASGRGGQRRGQQSRGQGGEAAEPRRRAERPERGGRSGRKQPSHYQGLEVVDAADILRPDYVPQPSSAPVLPEEKAAAPAAAPSAPPVPQTPLADGMRRLRVNIGFDDGFKGRGAVAKKIAALAGLNEGIVVETEARRDYAFLQASAEIAELVLERVDGAPLGKKTIEVYLLVE